MALLAQIRGLSEKVQMVVEHYHCRRSLEMRANNDKPR